MLNFMDHLEMLLEVNLRLKKKKTYQMDFRNVTESFREAVYI